MSFPQVKADREREPTPVPPPLTSSRRDHAIAFTRIVLLEPGPTGSHQSTSSLFRSTVQIRRADCRLARSG
jgi:hypothetical protein